MPDRLAIVKAELIELKPDGDTGEKVPVQFNPETLKVSYSNQVVPPDNTAKDQRETSSTQFVGKGSTKLSLQLWFDVTAPLPQGESANVDDVRQLTKKVVDFITPKEVEGKDGKYLPPGVRFEWGTFKFDGVVESLEESLEFFSHEGKPLRASISLSMSQQSIQFAFAEPKNMNSPPGTMPSGAQAGTAPLTQAAAGMTLQELAAKIGRAADWKTIAEANNIENPRLLEPGRLLDMHVR
ncbi:MAG: hypothetical protein A2X58_00395 [Nitrospirae bacterium GWC2_56_14]|nr:MAG: hypothetical protein A2X58_00395 [Nitrospirae bacterium GWC2_56_14]